MRNKKTILGSFYAQREVNITIMLSLRKFKCLTSEKHHRNVALNNHLSILSSSIGFLIRKYVHQEEQIKRCHAKIHAKQGAPAVKERKTENNAYATEKVNIKVERYLNTKVHISSSNLPLMT